MTIKGATSFIKPFSEYIDLETGAIKNPKVHLIRNASDMRGYYKDESELETVIGRQGDPLHYETYESDIPQEYGHLIYGVSRLQPGLIGRECFMTKGHYHTVVETGEIYICMQGQGYMMMKTSDGKVVAEKMERGSMVYVPPYWAHRSINTGAEPLTTFFIYPADAGHNYGDITSEGFPQRIFIKAAEVVIE